MASSKFMDRLGSAWAWIGDYFGSRPTQILGILIGAAILVAVSYSSINTTNNTLEIDKVQAAFCNGDAPFDSEQRENCRRLLDQLLKNPTPEQARRLREIVKGQ